MAIDPNVLALIYALEGMSGFPFVVLQRVPDMQEFYEVATKDVCDRTGDNFCAEHLMGIDNPSNLFGSTSVLNYEDEFGREKSVCLILPPSPSTDPSYMQTILSGYRYFSSTGSDSPSAYTIYNWMTLMWAAECLNSGNQTDGIRSDVFASIAMTLIEGSPSFAADPTASPTRKISVARNTAHSDAGIDLAERIMMDIWKLESYSKLDAIYRQSSNPDDGLACEPAVIQQGNAPIASGRDQSLPACTIEESGFDNFGNAASSRKKVGGQALVTDQNLHLWMYGGDIELPQGSAEGSKADPLPVLGAPPEPWSYLKPFDGDINAAVNYIFNSADVISKTRF